MTRTAAILNSTKHLTGPVASDPGYIARRLARAEATRREGRRIELQSAFDMGRDAGMNHGLAGVHMVAESRFANDSALESKWEDGVLSFMGF